MWWLIFAVTLPVSESFVKAWPVSQAAWYFSRSRNRVHESVTSGFG